MTFHEETFALFEQWAKNAKISISKKQELFGEVLVIDDRIAVTTNPIAESSQALKDFQKEFKAKGISLYFLWPWDGDLSKLISHFESKLGMDTRTFAAKKLDIAVIDNKIADQFMKENHIQGMARGVGKISIGLSTKEGELIAVQQFARYRFSGAKGQGAVSNSPIWEGLRLSFKPGVQIHGGATRLQKFFEQNYKPEKIISYINNSHSIGDYKGLQKFTQEDTYRDEAYMWVLEGEPVEVPIIDKDGNRRLNDLDLCRKTPFINPTRIAGAFGKGIGQTFYGGKLGSRAQLRAHKENGHLVHNDVILEAIGYVRRPTPGQSKWVKDFPENQ